MAERVLKSPESMNNILDVDCFLERVDAVDEVILDFIDTTFIRPVGVVSFLATMERLAMLPVKHNLCFLLPKSEDVRIYLRQAGVFDAMREYCSFQGEQPEEIIPERPPVRPMVSCTHFRTDSEVEELGAKLEERFRTELFGIASILQPCYEIFSELAMNILYHAESKGGYVLAQRYNYSSGPVIDIAVADCGIGIRASLAKNPDIAPLNSDPDAISLALEEGVTSLNQSNRGYGLSHVTDRVNTAKDRIMVIRSGHGIMTLQGDGTVRSEVHDVYYPGTIVNVIIPCGTT